MWLHSCWNSKDEIHISRKKRIYLRPSIGPYVFYCSELCRLSPWPKATKRLKMWVCAEMGFVSGWTKERPTERKTSAGGCCLVLNQINPNIWRLSRLCFLRLWSCGLWYLAILQVYTSVSKEHDTLIFSFVADNLRDVVGCEYDGRSDV
jgi:hypothetical protein